MTATAIIARADDFGSFRSANRAIAAGLGGGVLRNVSVMVPTPHWREAVALAKANPKICFGLHATITSEWRDSRWGPVLGAARVPSLVRADGTFLESTMALHQRGPDFSQVRDEILAQIRLAREAGLELAYLDEHMAFGWAHEPARSTHRLGDLMREICQEQGLRFHHQHHAEELGGSLSTLAEIEAGIAKADGGTILVVNHPAFADDETLPVRHPDNREHAGAIAAQRFDDLRLWLDPGFSSWLSKRGVRSLTYSEAP